MFNVQRSTFEVQAYFAPCATLRSQLTVQSTELTLTTPDCSREPARGKMATLLQERPASRLAATMALSRPRRSPLAIPLRLRHVVLMNPIKRLAIALMAVLMIGLMIFYFVSLLLAKIAMAVLLFVAILVALTWSRPKKNHPGHPLPK